MKVWFFLAKVQLFHIPHFLLLFLKETDELGRIKGSGVTLMRCLLFIGCICARRPDMMMFTRGSEHLLLNDLLKIQKFLKLIQFIM